MPEFIRYNLKEKLIEAGLINTEQFEKAMVKHVESNVQVRQALIDLGYITEQKLMEFMGASLGIPFMKELSKYISDAEITKLIPEKYCQQYLAMPIFKSGSVLTVAMADPLDVFAIDDLESIVQCKIEVVLSAKEEILKCIEGFYRSKELLEDMVKGMAQEAEELEIVRERNDEEIASDDVVQAEDAPIIKLVNTMISQAIKERASDIHIEPDDKKLRVRYRIDGMLREAMVPPKRLQASITSRIKIMAGMDISIKRQPQDGRFKLKAENRDIDVRISTVPTSYGETVVMRLLDQKSIYKSLENSGLSQEYLATFKDLISRPYGIFLVTGPTGSGKSTTLYIALQSINSLEKNIITIEEPVEYEIEGITQISVNVKAGVTFPKGLRSILRQDPDVIMIGEIRDFETADIAVRAALTGHLVFSTLHTNDAAGAIARLVDMGTPLYLVTSAISGILAQRLVRTICKKCRESYTPRQEELLELKIDVAQRDCLFYRGAGCEHCGQTGYLGRAGIYELMVVDKELRKLIHEGKSSDAIREAAQKHGMKTLWEDGLEKVLQGVTTIDEVKRVTFMDQDAGI